MRLTLFPIMAALAGLPAVSAFSQTTTQLDVRAIPAEIAPGQNAFIEVSGTFPDGCTFGEGELSFVSNGMTDNQVQATYSAPEPTQGCSAALTDDRRVFGPIPFGTTGPDIAEMTVTFDWSRGELTGFGETAVSITEHPRTVMPETGTWWSPDQPGHGLSIEAQGEQLFAVAYSFNEAGSSHWATTQGSVNGGLFNDTWREFEGGNCWLCGTPYIAPGRVGEEQSVHMAMDGAARLYLRVNDTAGEALALQRFHLSAGATLEASSITVSLPDLSGWWVLTEAQETNHGPAFETVFRFVDAAEEGDQVPYYYVSEPAGIALSCSQALEASGLECSYTDCGPCNPPSFSAIQASAIGQDSIVLPNDMGVLTRLPANVAARLNDSGED